MAQLETVPNTARVADFVATIDESRQRDCKAIMTIMRRVTGKPPKMWGTSIIGYGKVHYRYASGREGDWFLTGLSPRKANLTLYITSGFELHRELMRKLGRFKTGKSCLYVRQLGDIDVDVLEQLLRESVEHITRDAG